MPGGQPRVAIVEGSAGGSLIEFEVIEQIEDDLAVVEANLGKLPTVDLHHLVDMPDLPSVGMVDRRVRRVAGARPGDSLDAS